jgi:aryl-alcohol dehydrogenase-like predicted oxidoreductase
VINERAAMIEQQKRAKRRSMRHHEVRRTTVARTKSDRVDAQLLANSLRSVGLRRPMFGCRPCSTAQRCAWGSRRHHAEPSRTSSALRSIPWSFCMQVARLGRTGLKVSRICLGTMTFGVQCDEAQSRAILDHAAEGGVSFIDTADGYPLLGNPQTVGLTEEILGRWLAGKRNNFIVATKCFAAMGPNPWDRGTSRRHILEAVDNSLRRLKTDWIDLYQLHEPDPRTPIEETLLALADLGRQGKIRHIGCSNLPPEQVTEAQRVARAAGIAGFICCEDEYSLLARDADRALIPALETEGMGLLPFYPLASGMLTGKYRDGAPLPEGSRMARGERDYVGRFFTAANWARLERFERFAAARGRTLLELAVSWLIRRRAVASVIAGATRPEQVAANVAAAGWRLAAEDLAEIDRLSSQP